MVATAPPAMPSLIDGMPPLAGWENRVQAAVQGDRPIFLERTNLRLTDISAGFAIALHMHQPTIPAGPDGQLINNLQHMFDHPYDRSEEHTSELQLQSTISYAVFCLKKKKRLMNST